MRKTLPVKWLVTMALTLSTLASVQAQETFLLKPNALRTAKTRLSNGDKTLQPALDKLIGEADKALQAGPFSVTYKKLTPPSGDKHDYMSVAPYWWPDPEKPDGLPYIRKDGQSNPDRNNDNTDSTSLSRMSSAVRTLSLAYFFTGKPEYAERAATLLRTWFLDPATKMNPHLNYGQAIPGRVEGRDIGIIDTHRLPETLDCILLLKGSAAWSQDDHQQMQRWVGDYLQWLLTSKHGQSEAKQFNNHGTHYDAQVAYYALFSGRPEVARKTLEEAKARRIAAHIAPDGGQPHELARTRSFSYSLMNLGGLFDLATLGEQFELDLWNFKTADGRSLRAALDYLAPYADPQKKWPQQQIIDINRSSLLALLLRGRAGFNTTQYEKSVEYLAPGLVADRVQLLYPAP